MSIGRRVHLGCDTGEATGGDWLRREAELLQHVTAVSIACGGHAGDERTMRTAVAGAVDRGVMIGAHPSYPDRAGFGRRAVALGREELLASVCAQLCSLLSVCEEAGGRVAFMKPHGALYHAAASDQRLARDLGTIAAETLGPASMVGPVGSACLAVWRDMGLGVLGEGFADRAYEPDGTLRAREAGGALVEDPEQAAAQARTLIDTKGVDLLCVHADTPNAVAIARRVRTVLPQHGRPGPS